MEFVDFEDMGARGHEISGLVYDARLAESEKLRGFAGGNLLLPFVAADAVGGVPALDREECPFSLDPDPYGPVRIGVEIALGDVYGRRSGRLVVALHEEFPFDFLGHNADSYTITSNLHKFFIKIPLCRAV